MAAEASPPRLGVRGLPETKRGALERPTEGDSEEGAVSEELPGGDPCGHGAGGSPGREPFVVTEASNEARRYSFASLGRRVRGVEGLWQVFPFGLARAVLTARRQPSYRRCLRPIRVAPNRKAEPCGGGSEHVGWGLADHCLSSAYRDQQALRVRPVRGAAAYFPSRRTAPPYSWGFQGSGRERSPDSPAMAPEHPLQILLGTDGLKREGGTEDPESIWRQRGANSVSEGGAKASKFWEHLELGQ
uniref:uncharacterized protein LOC128928282 n=1 Tax=Callithrix jacchus TaxID=9483 RepID=UPI0023DD22A2|nr:uncharacterized protein LOC128928282 [Callithrix jacchus]